MRRRLGATGVFPVVNGVESSRMSEQRVLIEFHGWDDHGAVFGYTDACGFLQWLTLPRGAFEAFGEPDVVEVVIRPVEAGVLRVVTG